MESTNRIKAMIQEKKSHNDNQDETRERLSEKPSGELSTIAIKALARTADEIKTYRAQQYKSGESGVSAKHKLTPARELLGDLAHAPQTKEAERSAIAAKAYSEAGFGSADEPIGKAKEETCESDSAPYGKYKIDYEIERQSKTDYPLLKVSLSSTPFLSEESESIGSKSKITESSESKHKLAQLLKGTQDILNCASQRFGEEQIASLKIAKDDVGMATSALLLGPDFCKMIGENEARTFGKRLIVFGIAPMIGMSQEAEKQFTEHTMETAHEGSSNFLIGTAIGAVLERCHPAILGTLTLGAGGILLNDQLNSPEHQKRNKEIANISAQVDQSSNAHLIKFSERTKVLIGPEIYHGAFALATGGAGLPEGKAIRNAGEEQIGKGLSKIDLQKLAQNFKSLGQEAIDSLAAILGQKPKWALAGGPSEGFGALAKEELDRGILMMKGEAKSSWKGPLDKLDADLKDLRTGSLDDICGGLKKIQNDLLNLKHESMLDKSQVERLTKLENAFQSNLKSMRDEYQALKKQVSAFEHKDPDLLTANEELLSERYYKLEDALYEITKERLEQMYRWKPHLALPQEGSFSKMGGMGTQARVSNNIENILSENLSKNPVVAKIFAEKGIPIERAKDWIGIPIDGTPLPAADHAGCDFLLVNKSSGEMYCFDVTQKASGMNKGRIMDSPLTNPILGHKDVPSERRNWVIGTMEDTYFNLSRDLERKLATDPANQNKTPRAIQQMAEEMATNIEKSQLSEIIARTLAEPSQLNLFNTRLPSNLPDIPLSRMIFEIELFRSDLKKIGFTDWSGALARTRDHLRAQFLKNEKNRGLKLPFYDN